ncbi:MAG: YhbY family RNA-binding protein [Clostridium sp.]|nr:MAG: YhbY family RNA-binding protein [Clostridium sp.]
MISTKDRAKLKGLSQKLEPVFQIGKNGVTETVVEQVSIALDSHELVKLNVRKKLRLYRKKKLSTIWRRDLTPIRCLRSATKIVLYRMSDKKGVQHVL